MRKFYISFITLLLFLPTLQARAQSIDILWQGEAYTPPFYEGRTLWSSQSRVTLFAIPQGLGNASTLTYKWTKNGTVLGNISGVGRNTLSFTDSVVSKPQIIKVDIIGADKSTLATASINITPVRPSLLVYENNPLYGFMFNKETSGVYKLIAKEITFSAFPLFFSVNDRSNSRISYEWRTNSGGVETKNTVTYRAPEDSKGSSNISLRATSKNEILQTADKKFLIEFGNQNNGI